MTDYLLDTNILILHLRNRPDITEMLNQWQMMRNLFISTVVRTELLAGMHRNEEGKTLTLLDSMISLPVDLYIADLAGRLIYQYARQGVALGLPDTLIAATALVHDLTLVTTNTRHFPFQDLKIHAVE